MIKIIRADNNIKYRDQAYNIAKKLHPKWFDSVAINKTIPKDLKDHHLIIAQKEDNVLGFLAYDINNNMAEISWMGVSPNNFNKGIGTKLLVKLEEEVKKEKVNTITVETLDSRTEYAPYNKTRAFYLKNGFIKTDIKKEYSPAVGEYLYLATLKKKV